MSNNEYTEKQLKIISGEIPIESVNGYVARKLYDRAFEHGDEEIAMLMKKRLEVLKVEAAEKHRQRDNKRNLQKRVGEFKWKQPKSNEYTEHQKKIVRGEIPLEEVHTRELISIHLKARNVDDYELSERFGDLISTRELEAKGRQRQRNRQRAVERAKTHKKAHRLASLELDNTTALSKWEQGVIMGVIGLNDCSEEQLMHILEIVQTEEDEFKIKRVQNLLRYKKDPQALYVVKDKNEALDKLEELLGLPIRRPESWFIKK